MVAQTVIAIPSLGRLFPLTTVFFFGKIKARYKFIIDSIFHIPCIDAVCGTEICSPFAVSGTLVIRPVQQGPVRITPVRMD